MRVRLAVAAVFAASLTCATPARATLYYWTYGGDGNHSGLGTLTTTGANSPFSITAITGTFDGSNILDLQDPGSCCGIPDNDNLLFSPRAHCSMEVVSPEHSTATFTISARTGMLHQGAAHHLCR